MIVRVEQADCGTIDPAVFTSVVSHFAPAILRHPGNSRIEYGPVKAGRIVRRLRVGNVGQGAGHHIRADGKPVVQIGITYFVASF